MRTLWSTLPKQRLLADDDQRGFFKHLKSTLVVVYGRSLFFGEVLSEVGSPAAIMSRLPGRWFAAEAHAYFEENLAETEGPLTDNDQLR